MVLSCKKQQERVEQTVLLPIEQWVQKQESKCQKTPCIWWMLCLNKVACWLITFLVNVCLWITKIVVRLFYRLVCIAVSLVLGILVLLIGRTDVILQAFSDIGEFFIDLYNRRIG